jgi:hypothetical protein
MISIELEERKVYNSTKQTGRNRGIIGSIRENPAARVKRRRNHYTGNMHPFRTS